MRLAQSEVRTQDGEHDLHQLGVLEHFARRAVEEAQHPDELVLGQVVEPPDRRSHAEVRRRAAGDEEKYGHRSAEPAEVPRELEGDERDETVAEEREGTIEV